MPVQDIVRDYFNRDAQRFDAIYATDKSMVQRLVDSFRRVVVERFQLICNLTPMPGPWTALDVGCGSGRYPIAFARNGAARVVGIDVAVAMTALAAAEAAKAGMQDRCEFVTVPFLEFQSDERFDSVVAMGYFDYLDDPRPHLEKMIGFSHGRVYASFPKRWDSARAGPQAAVRAGTRVRAVLLAPGCRAVDDGRGRSAHALVDHRFRPRLDRGGTRQPMNAPVPAAVLRSRSFTSSPASSSAALRRTRSTPRSASTATRGSTSRWCVASTKPEKGTCSRRRTGGRQDGGDSLPRQGDSPADRCEGVSARVPFPEGWLIHRRPHAFLEGRHRRSSRGAAAGTPVVVHTLHSLVFHDYQAAWKNRLYIRLKRICAPMTDALISVSEQVSKTALAQGIGRPEQYITIYSGMELNRSSRSAAAERSRRRSAGSASRPRRRWSARSPGCFRSRATNSFSPRRLRSPARCRTVRFLLVGDGPAARSARRATSRGQVSPIES